MTTLTFDLETILLPMTTEEERPFKQRAAEKEMSLADYLAFNPVMMSIVAIGYLDDATGEVGARSLREQGTEAALIQGFFKKFGKMDRYVTWNGRGFDFPVLVNRAAALGILVPPRIVQAAREYRYRPEFHIDVMDLMSFFGAARRPSLASAAVAYRLTDPLGTGDSGADVMGMVNASEWDRLEAYVMGDVLRTHQLYMMTAAMVGIPGPPRGRG